MIDISFCNCMDCPQWDCQRNLRYYKPETQWYSISTFITKDNTDETHKNCEWKLVR